MGHNPTPSAILDTKGTFIKHPEYRRPAEPSPREPLATAAPKDFSKEQKKLWKELMRMLPPGVAFNSDAWAIRHLVVLEAKSRSDEKMMAAEMSQLISLLDRFGLNPAARARIAVEAPKESALTKFLAGHTPSAPKVQ
jgi:phage terminase small subunit